jgi:hypothetical protein
MAVVAAQIDLLKIFCKFWFPRPGEVPLFLTKPSSSIYTNRLARDRHLR